MNEIEMVMNEICDLIGLSPQGIRLYEKYNAMETFRWDGNGYRYYYFENLSPMISLRSYRNLDIPLEKAAELCSGSELHKIRDTLSNKKSEMYDEIKRKKALLDCMDGLVRFLDLIPNQYHVFDFCERPALYFLQCEENHEILKDKDDRKLIRSWSNQFPFVKFCPLIKQENLSENTVAKIGFCVTEEFSAFVPTLNHPRVLFYEATKCIGGIVRVPQDIKDYYSVAEPALNYLKENNLELDGDILSVLMAPALLTMEPEKMVADYHFIWLPVKE